VTLSPVVPATKQVDVITPSPEDKKQPTSLLTPLIIVAGALSIAGFVAFKSGRRRRE
jgi:hypothetical protein